MYFALIPHNTLVHFPTSTYSTGVLSLSSCVVHLEAVIVKPVHEQSKVTGGFGSFDNKQFVVGPTPNQIQKATHSDNTAVCVGHHDSRFRKKKKIWRIRPQHLTKKEKAGLDTKTTGRWCRTGRSTGVVQHMVFTAALYLLLGLLAPVSSRLPLR